MADILDQIICITLAEDLYEPHKEDVVNGRSVSQKLKNFEITHVLNGSKILAMNFTIVMSLVT